jgi:hypothetical protein
MEGLLQPHPEVDGYVGVLSEVPTRGGVDIPPEAKENIGTAHVGVLREEAAASLVLLFPQTIKLQARVEPLRAGQLLHNMYPPTRVARRTRLSARRRGAVSGRR